jgi:hypothetical protein
MELEGGTDETRPLTGLLEPAILDLMGASMNAWTWIHEG